MSESEHDVTTKKGLSPLAWVGIGCGGIIVLVTVLLVGIVGFGVMRVGQFVSDLEDDPVRGAAEAVIRLNPELELIETDSDARQITFRNTQTGEQATLNFEDIAEGRLSVTTTQGDESAPSSAPGTASSATPSGTASGQATEASVSFGGSAPDWVPIYPDATQVQATLSTSSAEGVGGIVTCTTSDGSSEVMETYQALLEELGYEVTVQTVSLGPEGPQGAIIGELETPRRSVNVTVVRAEGETQLMISYSGEAEP